MTGTTRWQCGLTARTRSLVLLALGGVKVATAAQLRQLVLPALLRGCTAPSWKGSCGPSSDQPFAVPGDRQGPRSAGALCGSRCGER